MAPDQMLPVAFGQAEQARLMEQLQLGAALMPQEGADTARSCQKGSVACSGRAKR